MHLSIFCAFKKKRFQPYDIMKGPKYTVNLYESDDKNDYLPGTDANSISMRPWKTEEQQTDAKKSACFKVNIKQTSKPKNDEKTLLIAQMYWVGSQIHSEPGGVFMKRFEIETFRDHETETLHRVSPFQNRHVLLDFMMSLASSSACRERQIRVDLYSSKKDDGLKQAPVKLISSSIFPVNIKYTTDEFEDTSSKKGMNQKLSKKKWSIITI